MDKNGNITISYDIWKDGIGKNPIIGVGDIVDVDIFTRPGVAMIDFMPTEVSNSQLNDEPTCCAVLETSSSAGIAVIGTYGAGAHEYNGTTFSAEYTGSAGKFQGAVSWKDYILFSDYDVNTNTAEISAFDPTTNTVTQGFESMTTSVMQTVRPDGMLNNQRCPIAVGTDDVVYIGAGNIIGSIQEKAGQTFDPTNNATYTWNAEALDLPSGLEINGLADLNDFLMISAGGYKTRKQAIYPWDRTADSFDFPVQTNNGRVGQMATLGGLVYFMNGADGNFSVTNRIDVTDLTDFKNVEYAGINSIIQQTVNPIAVIDNSFYVAVSNNNNQTDKSTPCGIYKVRTNGAYTRLTMSNDEEGDGGDMRLYFTTVYNYTDLLVGWQKTAYADPQTVTEGVDHFGKSGYRYTGYRAKIESPLFQVGGAVNKKSYDQVEVSLAKELATGQGIKVYYRENLTDSWTTIGTYDFATYGAVAQINDTAKITSVSTLQIKVELTTGASSTTTPELISVRVFE